MSGDVFEVEVDDLPPFRFHLKGEEQVRELPHMSLMPIGLKQRLAVASQPIKRAMKAGKKPSVAQATAAGEVMLEFFEAASRGITDEINEHQLAALMKAWEEHSRIELGES